MKEKKQKYCIVCGCPIPNRKRRYCSPCKVEVDRIKARNFYHAHSEELNAKRRTKPQNSQKEDPDWLKKLPNPIKQEYWVNGEKAAKRMLEIGIEEYRRELRDKYKKLEDRSI